MSKIKYFFLILFLSFFSRLSDAQTSFLKTYSGYGDQTGETLIQCTDKGFLMVGYTSIIGGGTAPDIYIVKTDEWGNMQWNITYGGVDREYPKSVLQLTDGGFIIVGGMQNSNTSKYQVYVVRIDSTGIVLWDKKLGSGMSTSSMSYKICELNNGDFAIAGSASSPNYSGEAFLFKMNNTGNVIWGKLFGGMQNDVVYGLDKTYDDGLVMTGYSNSFGTSQNLLLFKIDSSGTIAWSKVYDTGFNDYGISVQQTVTNDLIIAGYLSYSPPSLPTDILLIKTDSAGNLIWSKVFGGVNDDFANVVISTTDGGYMVAGHTDNSGFGGLDMSVFKTDSVGDVLWFKTFGMNGYDVASDIVQTDDEGFAINGNIQIPQTNFAMVLVKTDSMGTVGCNEANVTPVVSNPPMNVTSITLNSYNAYFGVISYAAVSGTLGIDSVICTTTGFQQLNHVDFSIFPNPASKKLTINSSEFLENVSIEITDMISRVVLKSDYNNFENKDIDIENLISGIYFLKVRYKDSEQVLKFVVQND